MSSRQLRIALYSHDAMGMGHMRRNLLLAQTFAAAPVNASVLLIAGAQEMNALALPAGADCLTLPGLRKASDGRYHPRSLSLSLSHLVKLRRSAIRAALEAFEPDLLIVDKIPRGAFGELDPTLRMLRRRGARCVLGLRDVLDEPSVVRREWQAASNTEAVRNFFDAVWIYGDPTVYDLLRECGMPEEVTERARFTGYLDARARASVDEDTESLLDASGLVNQRFVLCQLGGGQDGVELATRFADVALPANTLGVLLTGPFMPADTRRELQQRAASSPSLRVLEFAAEPTILLRSAEHVVAMGGYNTVCEVLSYDKRALIVPRTTPRREQLIRAQRLQELGAVDMLASCDLRADAIESWLSAPPVLRDPVRERIDFNGLERLPHLVEELVVNPGLSPN